MTKTLLVILYLLLIIVMIADFNVLGFTTHNTAAIIMACIGLVGLSSANIAYQWLRATFSPLLLVAIVWFVLISLGLVPSLFFVTGLFQAVVLAALLYVTYVDVKEMMTKNQDNAYVKRWRAKSQQ